MKYILFFLLIIVINSVYAQDWIWQNPLPTGNTFTSVFFVSQDTGYIAGTSGTMYYTNDGGNSWNRIKHEYYRDFACMFFISSNTGWVAARSYILKTEDGGESWIQQEYGGYNYINSLQFIDENNGFATTKNYLLYTNNGGNDWYHYDDDYTKFDIFFLNSDSGWVVATKELWIGGFPVTYNYILYTSNGGQDWVEQYNTTNPLENIFFINDTLGWVIGGDGLILRTSDGGNVWLPVDSEIDNNLSSVKFINSNAGWIIGEDGCIFYSEDSGLSWERQESNTSWLLNELFIYNKNEAWIVGENGIILKTLNKGNLWENINFGTHDTLRAIEMVTDRKGWVVGNNGTKVYTSDGGLSWNQSFSNTNLNLNDIKFITNEDMIIVGDSGLLLTSTNEGQSWNEIILNSMYNLSGVYFVNDSLGWISGYSNTGEGVIFKTNDRGTNWEISHIANKGLQSVMFTDNFNGWSVGGEINQYNSEGIILKTTNGGISWDSIISEAITSMLFDVFFINTDTGWVVGEEGLILITTDGGESWERQFHFGTFRYFNKVFFRNYEQGLTVGYSIRNTLDGGESWKNNYPGSNQPFYDIDFVGNKAWLVGGNGTILYNPDYYKYLIPTPINIQDSLALVALYNSTNGSNWINNSGWLSDYTSSWYGISVTNGRVTELKLQDNNLVGSIPVDIGGLDSIQIIQIANNHISDSIPSHLSELPNLEYFDISFNNLSELPDLTSCSSLTDLYIDNNNFTFEDIEPNISIPTFIYSPQDSVGNLMDTIINEGESLTLSCLVGGISNTYQWFKDDVVINGANSPIYTIDSMTINFVGLYKCEIKNTIAQELTLYSRQMKVECECDTNTNFNNSLSQELSLRFYPNPIQSIFVIEYSLLRPTNITIKIHDMFGRQVETICKRTQSPGRYIFKWNSAEFSNGIYFFTFQADEYQISKKIVLLRNM